MEGNPIPESHLLLRIFRIRLQWQRPLDSLSLHVCKEIITASLTKPAFPFSLFITFNDSQVI